MAKKQKLKADTVLKNYWRDSRRFADLFNAVLFEGEEIIKAEELEDADTEESAVLEHGERAESIEAARDSIKIRKASSACGIEYVLLQMSRRGISIMRCRCASWDMSMRTTGSSTRRMPESTGKRRG